MLNKKSVKEYHVFFRRLPNKIRRALFGAAVGWVLIALLESIAYAILSISIIGRLSPLPLLLISATAILTTVLIQRAGFFLGAKLAGSLYKILGDSISTAKLSFFNITTRSKIVGIAGQNIPGFISIPAHQLQTYVYTLIMPVTLSFAICYITNLGITVLIFGLILISLLLQYASQRSLAKVNSKKNKIDTEISQLTLELVEHLDLLRSSSSPGYAMERIGEKWKQENKVLSRLNYTSSISVFFSSFSTIVPIFCLAICFLFLVEYDANTKLTVLLLAWRASVPIKELVQAGINLNNITSSINEFNEVVDAPTLSEPDLNNHNFPITKYNIEIKNISYADVLKNLSAVIPFKSRTAVVGTSGSGKSTLLDLLIRFDDPDEGSIRLGEKSLNQFKYEDLIGYITYVSQEPIVFTGSLLSNLKMGNKNTSDQEIEKVARLMQLGDLIDFSPDGINLSVGHNGKALSGGERQRVALARALLKMSPILILDEATSAIDEVMENKIIQVLKELPVTLIFVTHRDLNKWSPTNLIEM